MTAPARADESSAVTFFAPGVPAPKGSARAIKRGAYAVLVASGNDGNKRALRSWASSVAWAAKVEMRGALFTGPVRVAIVFTFARPKSHSRAQRLVASHAQKPDIDKLIRATFDPLTGIAWVDDSQCSDVSATKRWAVEGEACGATIVISSSSTTNQDTR